MAAELVARDLRRRGSRRTPGGWVVNLGLGMPTMCSDFIPVERRVIFHSENGLIGYGRRSTEEEVAGDVEHPGERVCNRLSCDGVCRASCTTATVWLIRSRRLDAAVLGV